MMQREVVCPPGERTHLTVSYIPQFGRPRHTSCKAQAPSAPSISILSCVCPGPFKAMPMSFPDKPLTAGSAVDPDDAGTVAANAVLTHFAPAGARSA